MASDPDLGPMLQRRLLGDRLKALRVAAGMKAEAATARLGWYRAKIGKIESGTMRATTADLDALLDLYRANGTTRADIQSLAKEARRKNPPARVANFAKEYVALWNAADEAELWSGDMVPGPVHTFRYGRAILETSVTIPASEIDRMAEDRAKRVDRITGPNAPQVWIVVGEEALHREIGGRNVLREQLKHLRSLASLPNVTLQIVAFSVGAHVAVGQRFSLLRFTSAGTAFAYVEGLTTADCLRGHHAKTYSLAFDRLRTTALTPDDSATTLSKRIDFLDQEFSHG